MTERKDTWTSLLVTMAMRMNKRAACQFLARQGVPLRIARRVMLRPDQRRALA